jgi:hypothetical protein
MPKTWLLSLACDMAEDCALHELFALHELWTTRPLARHAPDNAAIQLHVWRIRFLVLGSRLINCTVAEALLIQHIYSSEPRVSPRGLILVVSDMLALAQK